MSDSLQALRDHGPDLALESQALGEWGLSMAGVEPPGGLVTVVIPIVLLVPLVHESEGL